MRILHLIPVRRSLLDQIDHGMLPALQSALAVDERPDSADTVDEALQRATGRHHELDLGGCPKERGSAACGSAWCCLCSVA
jgi:hypothetical protein